MKKIDQLFLNLYLIVAVAHLFSIVTESETIREITKYLLMPLLMLHVYFGFRNAFRMILPLLTTLFFCWMGDIVLLYSNRNENYFLIGLAAFLLGHIFYIISFNKYVIHLRSLIRRKPWIIIFPLIYSASVVIILYAYLGDMKIPVIAYSAVITLMGISAINRFGRTNLYSFIFVLCGAVFFMISDTLIAIDKFYLPIESGSLLIMFTYIVAQFLIISGLRLHLKQIAHGN
ncbi:MAG: lysoplasmalogenase [Chitinophagales bacterium]